MQEKIEVLSGSKINNLERMKNMAWSRNSAETSAIVTKGSRGQLSIALTWRIIISGSRD